MTENVTIRIGANASQAIAEIGRVKSSALGLRAVAGRSLGSIGGLVSQGLGMSGMGGMLGMARLGPAGVAVGAGAVATYQIVQGMKEVSDQFPAFSESIKTVTDAFKTARQWAGSYLAAGLGELGQRLGLAKRRDPYGPITAAEQAEFSSGLAARRAANKVVVKPDRESEQRQKAQLQYIRETSMTLTRMERDMATQQWTDPW